MLYMMERFNYAAPKYIQNNANNHQYLRDEKKEKKTENRTKKHYTKCAKRNALIFYLLIVVFRVV